MMVGAFLLRALPRKQAMELAMTGRRLSAAEALDWGLVNRVVPREELDGAVEELTSTLLAQSPTALRLGKRAWRDALDRPLDDGLGLLADRLGDLMATEDAAEGFAAFLQKRAPDWKDR
jgi:enoyl-CoA hydratase/carnithine racemase